MTDWIGDHRELRWFPGEAKGHATRIFVASNTRDVAVDASGRPLWISPDDDRILDHSQILIGTCDDWTYVGVQVSADHPGFQFAPLRPVLIQLQSAEFLPVSAGMQLLDFLAEHQYCGRCGHPTVPSTSDRGRTCEACHTPVYPRISPCVIVLITRGDELLLARSPRFVDGMYSTLAGFVEAGESAEHACHREIFEEVGVEIDHLAFQGSQSWPFKHSLMLGYRATWKSGDIAVDGVEIVDAQWFHKDALPTLPPHASISRGMIDAFLAERRA